MNMIKLQRTSKKISIETQNALKKKSVRVPYVILY